MAGDYTKSLALLDSAQALEPDQADCLNLRGIIALKQNEYDKAEAAFSRAVALDAKLWAAQFNLGEIPFRKKDFAKAKTRFEDLLAQTDRYKQRNQWELVDYKAYLCCLMTGDTLGAQKKFERLPPLGGVTPAYQYAQAAQALSKKETASAAKWISAAQGQYNGTLNTLYADSLVTAGWGAAIPVNASLASARQSNEMHRDPSASAYLDPRAEAAAAEPLPAPDGGILPMLPQGQPNGRPPVFRLMPEREPADPHQPAEDKLPPGPAPTPVAPVSGLDNGGLLQLH